MKKLEKIKITPDNRFFPNISLINDLVEAVQELQLLLTVNMDQPLAEETLPRVRHTFMNDGIPAHVVEPCYTVAELREKAKEITVTKSWEREVLHFLDSLEQQEKEEK